MYASGTEKQRNVTTMTSYSRRCVGNVRRRAPPASAVCVEEGRYGFGRILRTAQQPLWQCCDPYLHTPSSPPSLGTALHPPQWQTPFLSTFLSACVCACVCVGVLLYRANCPSPMSCFVFTLTMTTCYP